MPLRIAFWFMVFQLPRGHALPVVSEHRVRRTLGTRDTGSGNKASAKIIVPVVLAIVVSVMVLFMGWWRRRNRTRELINQVLNNASTTNNNTSARAGGAANSTQAAASTPGTGANAAPRPPRRRRRRRLSQISTKSLPAYNEQAGDEEIVLVRRTERQSMSDDDEDDDSNENGRRSANATSTNATTADARPLLDDSSPEMPRVSLASSTRRRSLDDHERNSQSSPLSPEPNVTSPEPNVTTVASSAADLEQAEANTRPDDNVPSYFEAVNPNRAQSTHEPPTPEPSALGHTSAAEATTEDGTRQSIDGLPAEGDALNTIRPKRKSVFRQLFALNKPGSTSATPSESIELDASARPSISVSSTRDTPNHRPSASISTLASASGRGHMISPSLSSLILTRSRSPTQSTDSLAQRLNISAPIPTTLVRTELSYPRAGPTPEQIRFLSSRESLGRFGMPYGEQAIAAARSRENLSTILPPQYEAPSPETTNPDARTNNATENQNTDVNTSSQVTRGPIIYTPGELALRRTESSAAASPEQTTTDQHQPDSDSATPQSTDLHRSPSSSTGPRDNQRASVYTTNSFVTAAEGSETATQSEDHSGSESPPTPTAETFRESATQGPPTPQRGQTILVPESSNALHPELTLVPATPTVEVTARHDNTT